MKKVLLVFLLSFFAIRANFREDFFLICGNYTNYRVHGSNHKTSNLYLSWCKYRTMKDGRSLFAQAFVRHNCENIWYVFHETAHATEEQKRDYENIHQQGEHFFDEVARRQEEYVDAFTEELMEMGIPLVNVSWDEDSFDQLPKGEFYSE